jgi:hypothetical protein
MIRGRGALPPDTFDGQDPTAIADAQNARHQDAGRIAVGGVSGRRHLKDTAQVGACRKTRVVP